jgi:PAS domain S-box-containing protein
MEADFNRNGDGQRYRILLEALNHVVFVIDDAGKFVYVSPGCFEILGLLPEEMIGRAMTSVVVPEDTGRLCSKFKEVKNKKSFPSDYRVVDTKGTIHHVRAVSRSFTDTDGKIYVLGIIGDISTWRGAEDALVVAQKKLEILSSITRHDINNQLTVVFGYLSFLEEEDSPLPPREIALRIRGAATTIQRINRFSKDYQDLGIIAPVWQNVGDLMARARQEVHAPGPDITIGPECSATDILADPMAGKVFYNLLDNSLRHGGAITSVKLSCHHLRTPAFRLLTLENHTPDIPVKRDQLPVHRQRRPHLRRAHTRLHLCQKRSVARRHSRGCFYWFLRSLAHAGRFLLK